VWETKTSRLTRCGCLHSGRAGWSFFFWRQSEGGTNAVWCISGGNQSHLLVIVRQSHLLHSWVPPDEVNQVVVRAAGYMTINVSMLRCREMRAR
jgi:hypothetical protein